MIVLYLLWLISSIFCVIYAVKTIIKIIKFEDSDLEYARLISAYCCMNIFLGLIHILD